MTATRIHKMALVGAAILGLAACQAVVPTADRNVADIHANAIVLDAHADIAIEATSPLYLGADGRSKVAADKLTAGGFDAVVMAVAAGPQLRTAEGSAKARAEAAAKLAAVQARVAANPDTFAFATSSDAVRANSAQGQISIILGFQNAQSLEGDIDRLDALYADGVRLFALTHLGHNDFADSSRPRFDGETGKYEVTEEHGGLSALGVAAVQRIDALGGLVDVSQLSKAATLQVADLVTLPVIASHSNVKALSDVTRNLSDEEIDRIGETGGVVHIAAFSAYLVDLSDPDLKAQIRDVRLAAGLPETYSYPYELYWELKSDEEKITFLTNMRALVGRETVSRMVDHIDYVADRIGVDHVGIGTDFNHGGGIVGFEEADGAASVTAELVRRGYSDEEINKIWGGNFLRVLDAAATR
ncbi:MAG: dipeptidase [Hyphomonadaceae bacterium]|nr:dipeptidase [Hyphomonadaceae bacterium]